MTDDNVDYTAILEQHKDLSDKVIKYEAIISDYSEQIKTMTDDIKRLQKIIIDNVSISEHKTDESPIKKSMWELYNDAIIENSTM